MNWWLAHNFDQKRQCLEERARIIKAVRAFFDERDFTHVETPVMQICPGVDTHIHGFEVEGGPKEKKYLQTSPEFVMKKLLVAGMERIYQICPVFRREENTKLHNPEFTMIEWYRAGADYTDIMDDFVALLRSIGVEKFCFEGKDCNPHQEWQKLSVEDAFREYAGIDLKNCFPLTSLPGLSGQSMDHPHKAGDDGLGFADDDGLGCAGDDGLGCAGDDGVILFRQAAEAIGIRTTDTDNWDDVFHAVMAEKIEPHLGVGTPTILYDYPASMGALARKKPSDPRWAERFELYVCGVELANAFSELTDAAEQRARIEADMKLKRELYGFDYPIDEDFLKALEHGMPEAGGIALGLDRLIMLALGANNIGDVLWAGRA